MLNVMQLLKSWSKAISNATQFLLIWWKHELTPSQRISKRQTTYLKHLKMRNFWNEISSSLWRITLSKPTNSSTWAHSDLLQAARNPSKSFKACHLRISVKCTSTSRTLTTWKRSQKQLFTLQGSKTWCSKRTLQERLMLTCIKKLTSLEKSPPASTSAQLSSCKLANKMDCWWGQSRRCKRKSLKQTEETMIN